MALTDKLTAIGNAIREKTGGTDLLTLDQMPTEISNIQGGGTVEELTITSNGTYNPPTGIDGYAPVVVNVPQDGGPPAEALVLTGNCEYRFAHDGWSWFIREYGDKITTKDVSNCNRMFYYANGIDRVPFDINLSSTEGNDLSYMFSFNSFTTVPYLRGNLPVQTGDYSNACNMNSLFFGAEKLKTIPEDWFETFGGEEFWTARKNYSNNNSNMFSSCNMLRNLPRLDNVYCKPRSVSYSLYQNFTNSCYALDEVVDLPVEDAVTYTSNAFNNTFYACFRINRLKFKTNDDGSAKTARWKTQTIDLSRYTGIADGMYYMTEVAGFTTDTQVTDASSYESLKSNEDWWACDVNYSRYNHNSAVETINSLPDTSAYLATAGGTNTIKFKGESGALTDGGAINTLTEEEIAVATAKGWTVTLV